MNAKRIPFERQEERSRVCFGGYAEAVKMAREEARGASLFNWLPLIDEFRHFLMSEEADMLANKIQHFDGG